MTFENRKKNQNPIVDNVTNSNNKNTPMINFNPFNTQQREKQGCGKYSRTCPCGHLYCE
jgi:hypothetical protein